jgi:phosphoribosylformylglycinamidine synthase
MAKVKALIITGYGLNCEAETRHVLELAGASVDEIHLSDLVAGKSNMEDYHFLAFIGGFSFGDHIAGGKAFANRLKCRLGDQLKRFVASDKLIIGICNGFQALVKLGLLPGFDGDYETQRLTIGHNESGVFRDGWILLKGDETSNCVFTKGIDYIELPVRHGEGNIQVQDKGVLERLKNEGQVVFRYAHPETGEPTMEHPHNPNGSVDAIAGICDPEGRIFGLMPHPEAFWSPYNHPHWIRKKMENGLPEEGGGMKVFRNAVAWLEGQAG